MMMMIMMIIMMIMMMMMGLDASLDGFIVLLD